MARRSRRRNRRRSRRRSRRRNRRGGQNYGSKTAKASQKYKGAHSTRATRLYDRKLANKRRMQRGPPKKAPPPPPGNNLALIPTSRIPLSNPLKLSKQIGVSVSEVKAGKKAANIAANKVGDAVKGAASQTVAMAQRKAKTCFMNRQCPSGSVCKKNKWNPKGKCTVVNTCPRGCVAAGGRRSRRRR